jgi:hypothetical protein
MVAAATLLVPITCIEVAHDTEQLLEKAKIVRRGGDDSARHSSVPLSLSRARRSTQPS